VSCVELPPQLEAGPSRILADLWSRYDPRLPENVEYHEELRAYAEAHLPGKVTFLCSFR
jgi:hypothetical protein